VLLLLGLPLAFVIRAATDDGWREVTSMEVLEEREVIYLPQIQIFLVHADPPLALSDDSPHVENDPVAFCRSSETFQEIHGGVFDRRGHYLDGPPPRGLDRIATRIRDGLVEINVSMITEGPPRGAGPPERPNGPFCSFEDRSDPVDGFLPPPQLPL
jgi:hypothetical protein